MASIYLNFLEAPTTAALAANATLTYVTTTTVLSGTDAIVKHLTAQAKQLSRTDGVLNTIEGSNGISVETKTTITFRSGGGAFLPGIDDNLLDEKAVVLPIVHIVTFDGQQKISQIRQYWEQGTLLKQVEAIGRSGRNWPIREGKALVDVITNSLKADGQTIRNNAPSNDNRSVSVSATRDPHASLQLFSPQGGAQRQEYDGPKVAPRESARPAPRDYSELFSNGEQTSPTAQRSSSPSKVDGRSVKGNAGKNFTNNRLFDENAPIEPPSSPEKKKTFGQKYDHFAFGDGEDARHERTFSRSSKATSHFSFEDFATPPKVSEKVKPDQSRNWGAGIDEDDPEQSPDRREVAHRPRKDANAHFEIADESPAHPAAKRSTTTNVDNARRGEDFGSHFEIADKSPAGLPKQKQGTAPRTELEPHWSFGTPAPAKKIYKTAGDGMGGRGARSWGIGDESDPEVEQEVRKSARGRQAAPGAQN